MTTLHTIHKSWHNSAWLYEQLLFASKGDAILLIEDAVLATQSKINLGSFVVKCQAIGVSIFVLNEDCKLRGVDNQYSQVKPIDYSGFVRLVEEHDKQVVW